MESKGEPEKDKYGQLGMLMWITNQNIKDLKEAINKYWQDAPDKEESQIKRMEILNKQLHEFWKVLNPS